MKKILEALEFKINEIGKTAHPDKLRLEAIEDLERLKNEISMAEFKISKGVKDKNILNSLLAKTSENLENALKNLRNQKDELRILLDTLPALVYFKDSELRYHLANKAFLDFSGKTQDALEGKTLKEVFRGYHPVGDYERFEEQVIEQGKFFFNVEEQLEKKGKNIWVHTNIAPVRNHSGKIIGLIGVSWDVTDQKRYESELKHSKEIAEESERVKDQFLTNMSHELRTPLNGVMGMTEILAKTKLDDRQQEYLKSLRRSGDHLVSIIDDIFSYSSFEKEEIKANSQDFDIREIIEKVALNFDDKCKKKEMGSIIDIDGNIPERVKGDPQLLGLVLRNLYSNALKFTEKGKITVRAFPLSPANETELTVRFEVEDTGIGIREKHKKLLFESFSQLDISSTKPYQGTGLGLAISKKVVDLLKGEIGVESEWQKGSTFWFTVPFIVENHDTDDAYNKQKILELLTEYRVLLVEDNLINQKITSMTLEKEGCHVDLANNGAEGLKKYQENLYDLVLMDIQMPVMDGLDATRRIREFENSKKEHHAFIIALSANALKDDREKAMASGMDGFLAKPFKPEELFQLLFNLIIRK